MAEPDPQHPPHTNTHTNTPPRDTPRETKTIKTHHCRFCSHLLLATTHALHTLPHRSPPARDRALILPLNLNHHNPTHVNVNTHNNYTILLSTTLADRSPTIIRREDGFEKRRMLRCGRCRVVVGYFLDEVHFPRTVDEKEDDDDDVEDEPKVVYILPGALVDTDTMSAGDEGMSARDGEWRGWRRE